jgi:mRNA interferase HigB
MHVISRKILREFWEIPTLRDAEQPLKAWLAEAKHASWEKPADVKKKYGNASILHNNRVVFNKAGKKARMPIMTR